MRRVHTLLFVVALTLLAIGVGGTAAVSAVATTDTSDPISTADPSTPSAAMSVTAAECEVDNNTAVIGCWNGSHYTDDLEFDQSDGLTEAELEELTHRTMARVEHLRERPFQSAVPVETVTRSEFADDTAGSGETDDQFQRWNDQVWKALFVVGEDDASEDAINDVFGGAVSGFYSPSENRIVLVVGESERLQISELTLAHELGHAMQDQYDDLSDPRYVGATQDADLAVDGIVEGEVVYLEELFDARCEDDWSCLETPADDGDSGGTPAEFNFGILQTVLQPYSDGAVYAEALVEEGGWSAVDDAMAEPPTTTSAVIHREPDYETTDIEFNDTATDGWELYPDQGVDGAETTGEASMFVMFWYQAFEYDIATFEPTAQESVNVHLDSDATLRTRASYNYAHESTDGWAGDELYPYRNDDRDGYVWVTEWQTDDDAEQFHETYRKMLTAHGDADYDEGTVYVVDDGDFRGAYGIEHDGTTVTIAHAPDAGGVLELRPDSEFDRPVADDNASGITDNYETPGETDDPIAIDDDTSSSGEAPGFGVVVAVLGLIAATLIVRRLQS